MSFTNSLFPLTPIPPRKIDRSTDTVPLKAANITSTLKEKGILVDHTAGFWEWRRRDASVERDVTSRAQIARPAVRALKNLFLGADAPLELLRTITTKAREAHNRMTLPWAPSRNFLLNRAVLPYKQVQSRYSVELEEAKQKLIFEWPRMLQHAAISLGPLFNPDDYPDPTDVAASAHLSHKFYPLSDASDVRLVADAQLVSEIQAQVRKDEAETYGVAVLSAWERFLDVMKSAVSNLSKVPKGNERFRIEWHDNLAALLPVLSCLNLNDDPRLDTMAREAASLLRPDPEEYKVSMEARVDAAKRAQSIYDSLSSIYSTLPGAKP